MTDLGGTYELGPGAGRVLVKTGREGLAARVGHDLTLEITQWSARVTVPADGDPAAASLTADLDLGSLLVRSGSGGAKPLSDRDRADIQKQARKILGPDSHALFTSTAVKLARTVPADDGPPRGGAVDGTLTLRGTTRPLRLRVTSPAPGRYQGGASVIQTDFGLVPYSGFFGALKLRDEVTVEFEMDIKELQNGPG